MKVGSITTDIIKNGLVFNMDAANRASTIPSTSTLKTFNTIDLSQSGSIVTDGTWEGPTTASFAFDGTDGYINTNAQSLLSGVSKFSFSVWVNINENNNSNIVWSIFNDNSNRWFFQLWNGKLYFRYVTGGSGGYYEIINGNGNWTSTAVVNEWGNVVMVFNGAESGNDRIKVWFNGVAITSGTYNSTPPSTLPTWSNNLLIAAYNTSTLYPINGNIGPTQIYNRALSANEVLHNYNALKGRFGL